MRRSKVAKVTEPRVIVVCCATLALSGCGNGSSGGGAHAQTFSLSGTLTGYSTSGLVLVVDGSNVPVSSGAMNVTLASGLDAGTAYSVSVATQPTGETCTVRNGSGVATADVSDISIPCTLNSYSIGGSIAGLTKNGLVLMDNGIDATAISSDDTGFTMSERLPYGSNYAITVQTQPEQETCRLSNGSGTVSANVTSVTASCSPSYATSVLYSFTGGSDGGRPQAGLIQGKDGNFYGTTNIGGAHSDGTVFELTSGGVETVLYSFAGGSSDGANPYAGLILANDGNLYGTTYAGGTNGLGTVFKLVPGGSETIIHSFAGGSGDGEKPGAAVIQASDGNFYGTTANGGADMGGTMFEVTPSGVETVLHSFGGSGDGVAPTGLIQGSDGNFYGTTYSGGENGFGTVFEVAPGGVETVLYSFAGGNGDGAHPVAGVIQASDGNFYGTTKDGGPRQSGSVFKLTPTGTETVLYFFGTGSGNGKGVGDGDGANPYAGLIQGGDGNFYGTTEWGGAGGNGTAFQITPEGIEKVMLDFGTPAQAGSLPLGGLIQGSDGGFYGTTQLGGAGNAGTLFKIVPLQ